MSTKWMEEYYKKYVNEGVNIIPSNLSLCFQLGEVESNYPFIMQVTEGSGEVSLTVEEHKQLVEYLKISLKKDNMEQKQIYFLGHRRVFLFKENRGNLNE